MKSYISLIVLMLLLASFPVFSNPPPDIIETEPNDTRDQANDMPTWSANGEIGVDGDVEDWFKVTFLDPGTDYLFQVSSTADGQRVDLEVYSDENVVGTSVTTDTGGYTNCYVPGTCYIRVLATEGQGPYRLDVIYPYHDDMLVMSPSFGCF